MATAVRRRARQHPHGRDLGAGRAVGRGCRTRAENHRGAVLRDELQPHDRCRRMGDPGARACRRKPPAARHADIYGSAAYRALVLGDHASAERLARIAVEDGIAPRELVPGAGIRHALVLRAGARPPRRSRADRLWKLPSERKRSVATRGSASKSGGPVRRTRRSSDAARQRAHAEEVLRGARKLGNPTAIGNALHALGWALVRESPDEALAIFEEASSGLTTANDNLATSALGMVAHLRARNGDLLGALRRAPCRGDERQRARRPPAVRGDDRMGRLRACPPRQARARRGARRAHSSTARWPSWRGSRGWRRRTTIPRSPASRARSEPMPTGRPRRVAAAMSFEEIVAYMLTEIDGMLATDEA